MIQKVLFIQGGGENGYKADEALVNSLKRKLGKSYQVDYPRLRSDENLPDFGWLEDIRNNISGIDGNLILVGHSLGASMILKYLSEYAVTKTIIGIFLIATPFWSGNEEWKAGLKLINNFADKLPTDTPIFLYHCKDDDEIPFLHFGIYKQKIPQGKFREFESGGHQMKNNLTFIANDIKSV